MARTTTRSRRVATFLPLALLAVVGTTHASTTMPLPGGAAPAPDAPQSQPRAPFGPVPATAAETEAVDAPASLSTPDEIAAGDGRFSTVGSTPAAQDIPSEALAAYQRAETVINAADPSCGLSWQLLAALGRVESDHGRFGGAALGADGVSTPAIVGPVLDGGHGTAAISDTDAGQYDGDTRYDRAVGPLQFIPSTWSVVGVDADNDGTRNPLDIDDAALAAAVYLCSGTDDLSKAPGQRLAVFRYNHSDAYVDLVLSVMGDYLQGVALPGARPVLAARSRDVGPLVPVKPTVHAVGQPVGRQVRGPSTAGAEPVTDRLVDAPAPTGTPGPAEPAQPTEPTTPTQPTQPTQPPVGPTEPPVEPTEPPVEPTEPPTEPSDPPTTHPAPTEPPTQPAPVEPEPGTLTAEDAADYCGDDLALVDDAARTDDDYDVCVTTYSRPTED